MKRSIVGLLSWIAFVALVAAFGAFASRDAAAFYGALSKPPWAPPAGVFGPVWTTLYVLMAIAAWRVWRRSGFEGARGALSLFVVQLLLNGAWSWLFFAMHQGLASFIDILVLWPCIAVTTALFWRRDRLAGLMLVPYLAWVGFALFLNFSVWQRNPAML